MSDLSQTCLHLQQGLAENRWTGFSLAAFQRGKHHAIAGGDVPDPSAAVRWYSAGKPVTAVGVLRLVEKSPALLDLPMETTFRELLGTYAGGLSLKAILTHQTGLRFTDTELWSLSKNQWTCLIEADPSHGQLQPGQAAYDPAGGWWLLGQWLQKHSGLPWPDFLHDEVLSPAGSGNMFFANQQTDGVVPMMGRRAGKWIPVKPGHGPGSGLCGSATDLARFYFTLLCAGTHPAMGRCVFTPDSVKNLTYRWREGKRDATFGHIVDFGLGVIVDSNRYGATTVPYGFGTASSELAFGHGGARSSIAFADPATNLAVAVFLNGLVPESEHQPRMRAILDLLRSDLA